MLEVKIVATRHVEYTFTRYVEYAAAVYKRGEYVTTAWKRYKRFYQLHRELVRKLGAQATVLPRLPPKFVGKGRHPVVVGERREQLCNYMNQLLRCIPPHWQQVVDHFLHLDRPHVPLPAMGAGSLPGVPVCYLRATLDCHISQLRNTSYSHQNFLLAVSDLDRVFPKYDEEEIEHAQKVVGECHDLVAELAEELRIAQVDGVVVQAVESRAYTLVKLVENLAHEQHKLWEKALRAERAHSDSLEQSVATLARKTEQARQSAHDSKGNAALADQIDTILFASDDETSNIDDSWAYDDSSDDDTDAFHDVHEHHDEDFHTGEQSAPVSKDVKAEHVKRRVRLASYKLFGEVSVWTFLKEAIGQDLTRITFPVAFNEPLTLLQRSCEDMEYAQLLHRAAACPDQQQRLLYVAAFAMSNYTATCERLGKPFNPLLHETFEYMEHSNSSTGQAGFRFLAEQVGHHPPVSASYAEALPPSPNEKPTWSFWADWQPKMKITPSVSCDVVAAGVSQVHLSKWGERFSWSKATTQVNGIIVGKLTITHYGEMRVVNNTSGEVCLLKFSKRGFWDSGPDPRSVTGQLLSTSNEPIYELQGSWDKEAGHLSARRMTGTGQPGTDSIELFRVQPRPADSDRQYHFTQFAIGLNHPGTTGPVAPTDSTLRPDVRAMEDGEMNLAADEKHRLEEKQRAVRKLRKAAGLQGEPSPRWFYKQNDETHKRESWVFKGGYWEAKETGQFLDCDDLYSTEPAVLNPASTV